MREREQSTLILCGFQLFIDAANARVEKADGGSVDKIEFGV
jgi:hypothetical protein